MARTELALAGVSFLKRASEERRRFGGWGGGDENKNKFEQLKADRSQSKERKFVPKCRRKNLLGVFAMTTWASTSGNFKAISSDPKGVRSKSVINEHFKRHNFGR